MTDLSWMLQASCRGVDDPEIFHDRGRRAQAREVCASCPVLMECRAHAMRHVEHGFWGGMSENQRYGRRAIHMPEEVSSHGA